MRLLFEASAPVRAPLAQVQRLIDDEWVLGPMLGESGRAYVDIDHRDGAVGFQGHWWYRGELSAAESTDGTVVTYRVYNIAQRAAWAVPLANRLFIGYARTVRDGVAGVAQAIEQHLAD
ncbi:hypothetical protein GCM10007977_065790 [Dactylosporangium sucinum]|uniref:Uncharacterized protein n=2 Tax=Dactylosporangium sucinum TaxID=1424081 RepID=A0A917X250_9ACTN|nr:hypothetical protein GCM10007977_065790 [Dactylosporangium sucinum]